MSVPSKNRLEEVEKSIRSCLISHKGDVTIPQLEHDYRDFEGECIPFREFNYDSVYSFLNSLHNVVRVVEKNGRKVLIVIDSEKSRHVSSLVAGQKPARKSAVSKRFSKPFRGGRYQNLSYRRFESHRTCPPVRFNNSSTYTNDYQRPNQSPAMSERNCYVNSEPNFSNEKDVPVIFTGEDSNDFNEVDFDDDEFDSFTRNEPEKSPSPPMQAGKVIKKPIVRLVQDTIAARLGENRLPKNSAVPQNGATNGHENSYSKKTYDDNSENSHEHVLNNACNGSNHTDKDDFVYDNAKYDSCDERQNLINSKVKDRLRIIIQNNPEGIWCADLPKKYFDMTGVELNYEEEFSSVREFACHLPDIFHCINPTDAGDYKLYNAQKPLPNMSNREHYPKLSLAEQYRVYNLHDEPEVFPSRLDSNTTEKLFPEGVMEIRERVGQISVTELCKDQDYEEVEVCEVFSPTFFWVQLRKKLKRFKKFMNDLHIFYEEQKTKYQISPIILDKGLNVACIYGHKWHRGIIITVLPDYRSLVHFYDYGTVKTFRPQDLFFLHRRFSDLPAQAIPCGLYNVKPYKSSKWSKHITWDFIKHTSCPLIATICSRNVEENSMLVLLTDTQKDEDFHINDWMYTQKYAELGPMIRMPNSYESQLVDFMLKDIYPKKTEIILLLSQNIDLKNLCDYEESRLPRWNQVYEENPEDLLSSSKENVILRPPPGFAVLNTIPEENLKKTDVKPGNCSTNNNNIDTNSLQMEVFKLHMKINDLNIGHLKYEAYNVLLQEQLNTLHTFFREVKISNSNNPNLQNPTMLNFQSPQQNVFSPYNFPKFTESPNESSNESSNPGQQNSSPSSVYNSVPTNSHPNSYPYLSTNVEEFFKRIPKLSEKTEKCEKKLEHPENVEHRKTLESHENLNRRESLEGTGNIGLEHQKSPENRENLNHRESLEGRKNIYYRENLDHQKSLEKRENPENYERSQFKETNPFRMHLEEKKPQRVNLKNFLDSQSFDPLPCTDANVTNETKTEYFKTSNTGNKPNPNIFIFGKHTKENIDSSSVKEKKDSIPTNNFSLVFDSCTEKVDQSGSKVVYESGPVMYARNGTKRKTEDTLYDTNLWKPILPAETSKTSESSVKINGGFSFNMNQPKSPAERAKERINRHIRNPKPADINVNKINDCDKDFVPKSTFQLSSPWENSHILTPDSLEKNENLPPKSNLFNYHSSPVNAPVKNENVLNGETEDNQQFRVFSSQKPRDESFASDINFSLYESNLEDKRNENLQTSFKNTDMFNRVEFNGESTKGNVLRNTNPFIDDLTFMNSQKKNEFNETSKKAELCNSFESIINSSMIDTNSESLLLQDNSSVCCLYPLTVKETSIIVIDLRHEGWLVTQEFVEVFTRLNGVSVMLIILKMMNVNIAFEEVDRDSHPSLLAQLDCTPLNVPRDEQNKIIRPVHLTPLKCALKILVTLKIINKNDLCQTQIQKLCAENIVLNDMMKLISSYGTFMRTKSKS